MVTEPDQLKTRGRTVTSEVYICDAIRTPICSYGGCLSGIRTDDLAELPIKALIERNVSVDWEKVDDVMYGCANQAGEDNRNVARMSALLAGLPECVGQGIALIIERV